MLPEEKGFHAVQIKYMAAALMVLDHTAVLLGSTFRLYALFRFFGRLTAPTMAYLLAEGYRYTRDRKKYAMRLLAFSLISWIPYCAFTEGVWIPAALTDGVAENVPLSLYLPHLGKTLILRKTGAVWTIFLGFLSIHLWDAGKMPDGWKLVLTALILWASGFGDWGCWMVLMCLIFYFLRENQKAMWLCYGLVAALYIWGVDPLADPFAPAICFRFSAEGLGMLLLPPFLRLYNGKPGKKTAFNRWFFYWFYPAHLLILAGLRQVGVG